MQVYRLTSRQWGFSTVSKSSSSMQKRGRQPGEGWLEHHLRCYRQARALLHYHGHLRWSTMWLQRVWDFAGHRARSYTRTVPTASSIIDGWRTGEWWQAEQRNPREIRHPGRFHAKLMQFERELNMTVRCPWREAAQDRGLWKSSRAAFVQRMDLTWASGRQDMLQG